MKKIISLFQRNYDGDRKVRDEVTPGAEWVLAGEGVATRKYDGTCCLVKDGLFYKRFTRTRALRAKSAPPPDGWVAATDVDPVTGKQEGWVPVGDGKEDRWHREAFVPGISDGTYELCGPKVQGNPEGFDRHVLIPHATGTALHEPEPARDYESIRAWLLARNYEGLVWHHPDGRMVKIKKKDFPLPSLNFAKKAGHEGPHLPMMKGSQP